MADSGTPMDVDSRFAALESAMQEQAAKAAADAAETRAQLDALLARMPPPVYPLPGPAAAEAPWTGFAGVDEEMGGGLETPVTGAHMTHAPLVGQLPLAPPHLLMSRLATGLRDVPVYPAPNQPPGGLNNVNAAEIGQPRAAAPCPHA